MELIQICTQPQDVMFKGYNCVSSFENTACNSVWDKDLGHFYQIYLNMSFQYT